MQKDLTKGNIASTMLIFSLPMMVGNLFQQLYNIADTLIVGRVLGSQALAAVGASYTLMTFLTSILLGLCMGSAAVFSMYYGAKQIERMKKCIYGAFLFLGIFTIVLSILVFLLIDPILVFMKVPEEVYSEMRSYLLVIFIGIAFTAIYNFSASLLRSVGNSTAPLLFLVISVVLNIFLDILLVAVFPYGVRGAAAATVISQGCAAAGACVYMFIREKELLPGKEHRNWDTEIIKEIAGYSVITGVQQSIMNFGILLVQGLVNSFGTVVMAAFTAGVKIDSFAYMPAQEFGNAFSLFISQNYGAKRDERVSRGICEAMKISISFCLFISALVFWQAENLIKIFVKREELDIIRVGAQYLRIEGSFYLGIGCLFLLYGFYRAVEKPGMSVVLTVISLGTRVVLAYILSAIPSIGVAGIWVSVPIGWVLADLAGLAYYKKIKKLKKGVDRS